MTTLVGWENFYIIIGSSAAALMGLMFVVITLTAERRGVDDSAGLDAFASPTVLHFCAVLLVAATLTTPGHTTASLSFCLTVIGVPTSVGTGVAQGGMVALNTMLASCSPGVAVVNIDNGFGAACLALKILGSNRPD